MAHTVVLDVRLVTCLERNLSWTAQQLEPGVEKHLPVKVSSYEKSNIQLRKNTEGRNIYSISLSHSVSLSHTFLQLFSVNPSSQHHSHNWIPLLSPLKTVPIQEANSALAPGVCSCVLKATD